MTRHGMQCFCRYYLWQGTGCSVFVDTIFDKVVVIKPTLTIPLLTVGWFHLYGVMHLLEKKKTHKNTVYFCNHSSTIWIQLELYAESYLNISFTSWAENNQKEPEVGENSGAS